MDGVEATKYIRKSKNDTYIIALTANVLPEERDRCFEAGMNDFLTKPVDLKILAKAMELAGLEATHKSKKSAPDSNSETPVFEQEILPTLDNAALDQFGKSALQLIELTLVDAASFYEALSKAINEKDPEGVQESAHALKSITSQVGALKLSDLARSLEEKGKSGELKGSKALFGTFDEEYDLVQKALEEYVVEKRKIYEA